MHVRTDDKTSYGTLREKKHGCGNVTLRAGLVSCVQIEARFALFLAMGIERLPKETSTPKSRACLAAEHTVRAMARVVAMKPHFEGKKKSTLSLPREWNSSTAVGLITCARFWIRKTVTSKAS